MELVDVTDFGPYVQGMELTVDEYTEIERLKAQVTSLADDEESRLLWMNAFPRGELLGLQLRLVERRLIQIKTQLEDIEIKLNKEPSDRIANEKLDFLRLVWWNLISFLRSSTGGEVQDVHISVGTPNQLTDVQIVSNELANAETLIKSQAKKIKALKRLQGKPTQSEMKSIMDENRFKNGKVNFSKIGESLGKRGETARKWIDDLGLLSYAISDNH